MIRQGRFPVRGAANARQPPFAMVEGELFPTPLVFPYQCSSRILRFQRIRLSGRPKSGRAGGAAACRGFRGGAPKPCAETLSPQTGVALLAGTHSLQRFEDRRQAGFFGTA